MIKNTCSLIQKEANLFRKKSALLFSLIKKYQIIAIFRHSHPDYDAFGSQYGLKEFIKTNFPKKYVVTLGDNHPTFTERLYPKTDSVSEQFFRENKVLGIILDTPNAERVSDQRYILCTETFRIDHHETIKKFATYNIVDTNTVAASELIGCLLLGQKKYKVSRQCCEYLFTGIVGESGRFMYANTSPLTFALTSVLISSGFDLLKSYSNIYLKEKKELEVEKYILNNYVLTKKGVAYYILNDDIQKNLNIEVQEGKTNINLFSNIEGIEIWCSIVEDISEPCYRVSLRSKSIDIKPVAKKYHGGGHKNACGAKLNSLKEIKELIEDLEALIS